MHYRAPNDHREIMNTGLEKTGRVENIDGIPCEVYFGSLFPGNLKADGHCFYKEWRNSGGFVMKSDQMSMFDEVTEEVHGLTPNPTIPDSVFEIPKNIKIQDGAKWLANYHKEHPQKEFKYKPPGFFESLYLIFRRIIRN
jgi:hypothetical protein